MEKQTRYLEIGSCNTCQSLDLTSNSRISYAICKTENRIIEASDNTMKNMVFTEILIPDWCPLAKTTEQPMTLEDLYNEVLYLKNNKRSTDQPKLERAFQIVNKYTEQNNISFGAAIGRIVGYMEAMKKKKGE